MNLAQDSKEWITAVLTGTVLRMSVHVHKDGQLLCKALFVKWSAVKVCSVSSRLIRILFPA